MEVHLGIDDTDSREGMCTTYVAAEVIERVEGSFKPPELVRLNPNIPWKTRGNGALAIRGEVSDYGEFKNQVLEVVRSHRMKGSDTGVYFSKKDPRKNPEIRRHSRKTVRSVVDPEEAVRLARKEGDVVSFGSGRGVVGALAAAGHKFNDMTLELLAYRKKRFWGTARNIDVQSVWNAAELYPLVWDTVDRKHGKIVLTPNSPCPVLYGVRGEKRWAVRKAHQKIRGEEPEKNMVFRTNQGTDEHIIKRDLNSIEPMKSVETTGYVDEIPRTIEGGHVLFTIKSGDTMVDCAAYEPTKKFRNTIRKLSLGDRVTVIGGVTDSPMTINIEKINVLEVARKTKEVNPSCPECGRNMESAGRNQGYRCRKCKTTSPSKKTIEIPRELTEGWYEVPPIARRHLAKPLIRIEMNYDTKQE
ncbi:tRNA(Ile)(2)-agmatinylcytidine synthase [Methanonatronarchaeum sp. AMET6-2]|uniref:tRNA(Ile)(2)-agmatinylcytidine synthase n=1 Tax=Methanonatronarchaeum sp. AMET6-2 TaxID=2933293 RepID=UPI001FF18E38|nr:tRNA(Ile)(2)-agmatinylcytidine synthase [Methanonatronarchaeum sp. AMET6-2]UOY10230.1 tRNA(Ile)(2)-agmatinylcytidine synthase [Methanonatronarchaeum sp. AMET6-2]